MVRKGLWIKGVWVQGFGASAGGLDTNPNCHRHTVIDHHALHKGEKLRTNVLVALVQVLALC